MLVLMKHNNITIASAILLTIIAIYPANSIAQTSKTLTKVVIDAGHGGKDPGALGKKAKEKDIVLDVSVRLGQLIKYILPSIETIYTRDKDVFIPLNERAEIANKSAADLFISIHANASLDKTTIGAEVYVLGLHRSKDNLAVAQKENSVIVMEDDYTNKYEGFDPTQPESYIIFELMQNKYLEQSILMASMSQESFVNIERADRGIKQAGFLVLRQTSMPSILIELGFISNAEEEEYLNKEESRQELAYSIFKALRLYKSKYDSSNSAKMIKENDAESNKLGDDAGLCYRIQVATSPENVSLKIPDIWNGFKTMIEDGRKKYLVGKTSTYSEAKKLLTKVKKSYPDCFIVALYDGEKISVRQARKKEDDKK